MHNTRLEKEKEYISSVLQKMNQGQISRMMNTVNQIRADAASTHSPKKDEAYQALMSMTGCGNAKKQLEAMVAASAMNRIVRERKGIDVKQYYHSVFRGNAGCAKTTCARLYASALAQAGVTKKDAFVELTRSMICGRYMGETAPKVREIFEKNAGGVIFIDEAYSLFAGEDRTQKDYGMEAIEEMIVCLEKNPDTVTIFAGYPREMDRFLESNPGLRSRIPFSVDFDDYTTEELMEIAEKMAAERGFAISEDAGEKLRGIFDAARVVKGFGNGRFCRNLVENAIRLKGMQLGVVGAPNMGRFMDPALFSDEMLFTLDQDCFEERLVKTPEQVRSMGFR